MADITLEDMDFGFDSPEPEKSAIAIGDFVVLRDFDDLPYTTGYVVGNVIDQEVWLMKVARAADDGLRIHPGEIFSVDHVQGHLVSLVKGVVSSDLAAESALDVNINGQSSIIVPNAPKAQIISSLMRMDEQERLPIEYPGSDRMALPIVIMTNADYYQERIRDLGDGLTRRVIPSKEISGALDFVNGAGFVLDTADGRVYLSTGREISEEDMTWLKSIEEKHGQVVFQAEDNGVRIRDLETGRSILQTGPEMIYEQLMDEIILYRDEGVFGASRTTNTVSGIVFAVHNESSVEMVAEDGGHFLVHGPRPMTLEQEESLKQAAQDGAQVKIDYSESHWGEVTRVNELQASRDPLLTSVPMNLAPFMGNRQVEATEHLLRRSEERQFYSDKMRELSAIVKSMPSTYETDGKSDAERPVSLRYFGPGDQQWFIIEKDRGDPENKDFGQTQAFGLADLGMDFPEMGYINIEEITRLGAELDYHFTPTTLLEVKKEHYPELVQDTAPALDADLVAHLEIRNRIRQGELGASGMPSIGGVDSLPGGGLPTGLGGDPIANAEKFLRNHAMRNPEQAAQWVAALRGNPEEYAQASGLEGDTIRLIAAQMEEGVNRIRSPQVGDLVRFEPHDKDPLRGEPFSGRIIAALDTSGGDIRYHLRAETGQDMGTEATVYGRNGSFRLIDLEQAYGFDRNAPERLSPQQKAIQEYTRFYETLPDRVHEVVTWANDAFEKLEPSDFDGYGKMAKALHEKVDNAFGVTKEGESRGDIAPDKALREAFAGNEEGIETLKEWGKAEGIRVTQSSEIHGLYDSLRERFQERLKEHGDALLKANDFKTPQEMVLATYWKHGINTGDGTMAVKLTTAVENKDLKTMLPWIGYNSQNPATEEAFTRLTGVALGKTQKARVAQLEAWAGPERAEALHKERSEMAKARAEEEPRKDLRRAFDALYGMSVQVSANSTEILDGQKWIEYKVAEGYTHVISRKRGAVVHRSLKNPETEFTSSLKDSRFQNYCKAIQALEPSGDIAKAMEAAKIPLDLPKKSEELQNDLVSVDVHGRDGAKYVVSLAEGKDDTVLAKLQAGEKSAVAELQQVYTTDTSIAYLGARMELDGKSVGVRISNGGNGALNIDVMSRKGMSAWEKLNVDPSRVPVNSIEGPAGDWIKTMLRIEEKSPQKAQGYQRASNQELNLGI